MSNETVQVPLDLLNALKNSVINRQGHPGGYAEATVVDTALQHVLDLIPAPPKVGDKITGQQFAALPPLSVAIDTDGDVWVVTNCGDATLIEKKSVYASREDIVTDDGTYTAADMGQGTLVHIGEEVN